MTLILDIKIIKIYRERIYIINIIIIFYHRENLSKLGKEDDLNLNGRNQLH